MFRTFPLSIIREFFTLHKAMVYVVQVRWQLASRIRTELVWFCCWWGAQTNRFRPDPARKLSANLFDIYNCCVYSEKLLDDGQRNCPKHVEFYSKNKFEKLMHLVGFIIRIYHEAWLPERQILLYNYFLNMYTKSVFKIDIYIQSKF